MKDEVSTPELLSVSAEQWEEARRRLAVVRPLVQSAQRTRAQVVAAADQLNLSTAQLYRLMKRYVAHPRLTTLIPQPCGGVLGRSRLSGEIEALVDRVIESMYLTRQRPRISDLTIEIRRHCHQQGLTPPSRKAITARVRAKPKKVVVARRDGRKAARDRFDPVRGSLEAAWPLSLVQIDHTLVDVIIVDSTTRRSIQRPWITLAIDVYSRCVVGFHLSLEPPSTTSVALCIAQAILPKAPWLAERKIEEDWPVHGVPDYWRACQYANYQQHSILRRKRIARP